MNWLERWIGYSLNWTIRRIVSALDWIVSALDWIAVALFVVSNLIAKKWRGHCYPRCDCGPSGTCDTVARDSTKPWGLTLKCRKCGNVFDI